VPVWPIVGLAFGKKRSAILELARQSKLPVHVFKVGNSYRVPTAELLSVLGLSAGTVNLTDQIVPRSDLGDIGDLAAQG
jgi:hypothetical protein